MLISQKNCQLSAGPAEFFLEWGQHNYWLGTFPFVIFLSTQNRFCILNKENDERKCTEPVVTLVPLLGDIFECVTRIDDVYCTEQQAQ